MPAPDEAPVVGLLLPPPEAAVAAVACWEAGEAVLPLDPGARDLELRGVFETLRPTHLLDGDGRRPLPGGVPVPAGVVAVVATSGTTGEPRGVELTRAGLLASAAAVSEALGRAEGDRWLCCLPLHHVAGLAVVGRAWAEEVPVVVASRFGASEVAAAPEVTLVSLVPTMLERLLHGGADLRRFRRILLGGAPVDPLLVRRAESAGSAVSLTYGLTETWGGVVHDGHALSGVELRLEPSGEAGRGRCGAGESGEPGEGEILVRAPMVMRAYRLRPQESAATLGPDGWLRTGDLGLFDEAAGGRLRILERIADVVNTGGVKVSPSEVERVLRAHPGVADVCVAGRPDPEWGQRVVAWVVPKDPASPPTLAELRAFAGERLSAPKVPREAVLVEAIPRSAGGKPLRRLLGAPGAGPSGPPGAVGP